MNRSSITIVFLLLFAGFAGCSRRTPEPLPAPARLPLSDSALSHSAFGSTYPLPSEPEAAQPQRGGELVILSGAGTPRHFNPAIISGSATAIPGAQIFASPLRYDEKWNPLPYLAKSWDIADDGLSVTLNLVENATFHDGHPITSEDVAFSVMTVKAYHPFKSMFAPVDRVDTPDPHTAVIRLVRPHPAILLAMSPSLLPILPKHVYGDGQNILTHPANLKPIGSGPYKLAGFTPGQMIELQRYDGFFIPGRPYLDKIVIRIGDDSDSQVVQMERQTAGVAVIFTDFAGLDRMSRRPYLRVTRQGYEGLGALNWLAFNLLRKPFDDKQVRQAIAYAVDPDFITGYLHHGRSVRATGPIAPGSPYYTRDVHLYDLDLNKAARLLDEAGYPLKSDGSRFSLTLDYIPIAPSQQRDVALYLALQLEKIGIKVQVRTSPDFPSWAARIGMWDFDMTMDGVYNWGDPVIGVHRTYLSSSIRHGVAWSNTQNYRNPQVDSLLEQAEKEMDKGRRKELYIEFQKILTEDLPIVWINSTPYYIAYNSGLGTPPLSIWGVHSPLDQVYWREAPARLYPPAPDLRKSDSALKAAGVKAIRILQEHDFYTALNILNEPGRGFLDMKGSGLHILGLTREGRVILDNSGQTKPGMDISGLLDKEGKRIHEKFLKAAETSDGGTVLLEDVWPNPMTESVGTLTAWCGRLDEESIICALEWAPKGGKQ